MIGRKSYGLASWILVIITLIFLFLTIAFAAQNIRLRLQIHQLEDQVSQTSDQSTELESLRTQVDTLKKQNHIMAILKKLWLMHIISIWKQNCFHIRIALLIKNILGYLVKIIK